MVKMNMSDIDISEPLSDMLAPLNNEQKEFLMNNYTIQTYKKNETIYCEGETPSHLDAAALTGIVVASWVAALSMACFRCCWRREC